MANVYVIGAGMVGCAMALDLANDHQVQLADYIRLDFQQYKNEIPVSSPNSWMLPMNNHC